MKNRTKQLKSWIDIGLCRCSSVAKVMGVSRQYVDKCSKLMAGISESQWVEFQMSMAIVEDDESQSLKNIEQNILRSAKQCSSKDRWIAKNAKSNLDRWVMILGKFKG